MKILLSDIPEEGLEIVLEEAYDLSPIVLNGPVKASLHIEKVGSEVLVTGALSAVVELECSRCLKHFPLPVDLDVEAVYHTVEELEGEERHEVRDEELDTGFYQGDELDLDELVREQIILSMPLKPLCDEACGGICPKCGSEKAVDTCSCEQKTGDPRLAVLKRLLKEGKE